MPSRLTSQQILTTRHYFLFMCDIFIRRIRTKICCVHCRKLKWTFCVGICTDGAAAMTGRLSGLTSRIKEIAPECESTRNCLHREAATRGD
uniref:Uncharacterized protein n=1 Tax=Takifugu rubripes TaxID=31033 RepID=A0A674NVW8_TAKRU